jgi:release factor glutamine methyltransferase
MTDILEHVHTRPAAPPPPAAAFRPSEYTGFLIHAVRAATEGQKPGRVVEIGVGSGAVLASLAGRGATRLTGTDVDPGAIAEAQRLMDDLGQEAELLCGDLWAPLAGRRFDLVLANPPHFPMLAPGYAGRPPHWSFGGPDGRLVMDALLRGLPRHLAPGGRAFVVHSAFLGRDATDALLAGRGLRARSVAASLMPLAPEKLPVMAPAVLHGAGPEAILRLGPHTFLRTEVLEITAAMAGG